MYRETNEVRRGEGSVMGSRPFTQGGRSFLETLTGRRSGDKETRVVHVEDGTVAYQQSHGRALIFRMLDLDALKRINPILKDLGAKEFKVQFLGGLSVMVTLKNKEEAEKVLMAAKEEVGRFSSICVWEGQSLAYERLAWLKIKGLPLHLMRREAIDRVGEVFRKIILRPPRSEDDSDLSYDYIGVLVGECRKIDEEITVIWRERRFKVWVEEEAGDWVPKIFYDNSKEDDIMEEDRPEDSPEVNDDTSEPTGGVAEECPAPIFNDATVSATILEDINVSLNVENVMEGFKEGDFISATNFDFDKELIGNDCVGDLNSNVNKRKKKKATNGILGRVNIEYSSSLEKSKVGKKSKGVDGPVGLEKAFDGANFNSDMHESNLVENKGQEGNSTENKDAEATNSPVPLQSDNSQTCVQEVCFSSSTDRNNKTDTNDKEVDETIRVGILLGAQLQDQRKLVQESIEGTCVQVGVK
ncbi:hypothetical protein Hdeb2414_s0003g00090061 [Helianthus debilis subsp. tardiflorus]